MILKKVVRIAVALLGILGGYELTAWILVVTALRDSIVKANSLWYLGFLSIGALIGGFVFYLITPGIIQGCKRLSTGFEKVLQRAAINDIILGVAGLILGLTIANLISSPFVRIPYVGYIVPVVMNLLFAYIGVEVAVKKKEEILNFVSTFRKNREKSVKEDGLAPKLLDTSVIIDGRIFDICKTGFIEGPIVIPSFVLEELRHIADSSDTLKRNRGRRGLDILNRMQKELNVRVDIFEKDFDDVVEVDNKLLKLAQMLKGKVITNDYNLNKVAQFQGVPVLNINELSNAVKPLVLPGEDMRALIIREGKESGQGVAYLDDGTMIVVEGGRNHIGENVAITVTSVLQTAAGRMIFARLKSDAQEKVI
ncbi:PIN/TRAM domain-containing protein [Caldanaerobius polysaccharolyticus]|nr:PIN/TRAM domain-containing protein [Caldanaerobius polysaccharolyticus]